MVPCPYQRLTASYPAGRISFFLRAAQDKDVQFKCFQLPSPGECGRKKAKSRNAFQCSEGPDPRLLWSAENVMNTEKTLNTKEILNDIKDGLTDFEIIEKHRLSGQELKKALHELFGAHLLTAKDAFLRPIFYDQTLDTERRRTVPREYLLLLIPVYDAQRPEHKGWLTDVSEMGCGVRGISVSPGQRLRLAIDSKELSQSGLIAFDALCCWSVTNVPDADPVAGLEIINIGLSDKQRLKELIRLIEFSSE
jgi:hypothetical protein